MKYIMMLLLLPTIGYACNGNEQNDVEFYQALISSKSADIDRNLKRDASHALTESMMKNISCSPIKKVESDNKLLPDDVLISIEYSNLSY